MSENAVRQKNDLDLSFLWQLLHPGDVLTGW